MEPANRAYSQRGDSFALNSVSDFGNPRALTPERMVRFGADRQVPVAFGTEVAVENNRTDDPEKTVFVKDYLRCRNGKWEHVCSHFRRPRQRPLN